jgi:glycine hydroxymethyltransferase
MVVNASNAERDKAHFEALLAGHVPLGPTSEVPSPVSFRDLREAGADGRVVIAFQGPASRTLLAGLAATPAQAEAIRASKLNDFMPGCAVGGIPVHLAHTGYTGAEAGFELFVHPDRAGELWDLLLERGRAGGVLACGLGARDSLRLEAGLPLFGHELEGSAALSLTEAGYGFVVRMQKPFFVGREAYARRVNPPAKRLLRLKGRGRRSVRGGQAILDDAGKVAGVVTSFAFVNPAFDFYVLAAVRADFAPPEGAKVLAVRATPDQVKGKPEAEKCVELSVVPRFPTKDDRAGWQAAYTAGG